MTLYCGFMSQQTTETDHFMLKHEVTKQVHGSALYNSRP